MDKRQETITVIKSLHKFQSGLLAEPEFVKTVCNYFDFMKDQPLNQNDLEILKRISNAAGIPHYFDHLNLFQEGISLNNLSLSTFAAELYESTLNTDNEGNKVHKYQKNILDRFIHKKLNRYFLSASTSFGKTHLVYEILKKMKYNNIVLIFPTIALLTENLEKLLKNSLYENYKIHTLSDVSAETLGDRNIFIYTPERFLSFIEKQRKLPKFDFIFIDEVYKIDNEYIIDEDESKENERDISYRVAAYYSVIDNADILLAGPYIEKYSQSFELFLQRNQIKKLDFNEYEIVGKSTHEIKSAKKLTIKDDWVVNFESNIKKDRLKSIVHSLLDKNENCIIYCSTPSSAERYVKPLLDIQKQGSISQDHKDFITHISRIYGDDWIVVKALKNRIGIHHGLVPKYIQKEIIHFFNEGEINAITSTTTITEGVNTSAKNIIITNNKKGIKSLKRFDAKNIAGRAGRFDKHYSGKVIILKNDFKKDLLKEKESINHKNFDINSQKSEIDLFYSSEEFLKDEDKKRKADILKKQEEYNIPEEVLSSFKVVSRLKKIELYDTIQNLSEIEIQSIKILIKKINAPSYIKIDWDGMQVALNSLSPILQSEDSLKGLIDRKTHDNTGDHSILIPMLSNYLDGGFKALVKYKKGQGKSTDEATRETSRFVYNTLKYQLVKYLGVFNILYKFHQSTILDKDIDEVSGIDKLLSKLEYNALTDIGRRVSDYGVPEKVLNYFENRDSTISFDAYENSVFKRVSELIDR